MAFCFSWNKEFSPSFIAKACSLLSYALNKCKKLPIIVDRIEVKELNMGSIPPELEILEIGDLAEDRFRGIFNFKYVGNGYIVLQTKVQINPLNTRKKTRFGIRYGGILAADVPLVVPMLLRLSDFKLSGIIILVFSKAKGITLVFRNDPIESIHVSSTFDSIPIIAQFLQKEIEKQLRTFFQEELPAIIHKLSMFFQTKSEDSVNTNQYNIGLTNEISESDESLHLIRLADINPENPISIPSMLRLAALASSQQTLSPFTPSINQAIYRSSHLLSTISDTTTTLTNTHLVMHGTEMQNTRQNLSLRQFAYSNKRWIQKKHNIIRLCSDLTDTSKIPEKVEPLLLK